MTVDVALMEEAVKEEASVVDSAGVRHLGLFHGMGRASERC